MYILGILSLFFVNVYAENDPVGGWAVVAPDGTVVSVIVCTESVCGTNGSWGGVMPEDTQYPGYRLVLQTNATADGNVAGWSTQEGTSVTYLEETETFEIISSYDNAGTEVTSTKILVPELTATDPEGMDLSTGIIAHSISYELFEKLVEIFPDNNWEDKSQFIFTDENKAREDFQTEVTGVIVEETLVPIEENTSDQEINMLERITNFVSEVFNQLFGWFNP